MFGTATKYLAEMKTPGSGRKFPPKSCQIRFWLSGKTAQRPKRGAFSFRSCCYFSIVNHGIHFPSNPSKVLSSYQCFVPLISSDRLLPFWFFGPTIRGRNEATKKHLHQLQLPLGRWRPPRWVVGWRSSQIPRNTRATAHHPWGQRRRTKARRLVHDTRRRQGRLNSGTRGSRNVARIGPAVVGDFGDFWFRWWENIGVCF